MVEQIDQGESWTEVRQHPDQEIKGKVCRECRNVGFIGNIIQFNFMFMANALYAFNSLHVLCKVKFFYSIKRSRTKIKYICIKLHFGLVRVISFRRLESPIFFFFIIGQTLHLTVSANSSTYLLRVLMEKQDDIWDGRSVGRKPNCNIRSSFFYVPRVFIC